MNAQDASIFRIILIVFCLIVIIVCIPNVIFYSNGQAQHINVVYAIFMLVVNVLLAVMAAGILIYLVVRSQSSPRPGEGAVNKQPQGTPTMYVPYTPSYNSPVTFG